MNLPRLNIGCGYNSKRIPGVLNCDVTPGDNVDVVFDAQAAWPFDDNSIAAVSAYHVLEHLPNFEKFFSEAWRVLAPGGMVILAMPHANSDAAFGDPTHVTAWNPIKFCFLQPGYDRAVGNPQHQRRPYAFQVEGVFERVNTKLRWLCRRPIWKIFGQRAVEFLWNAFVEIHAQMRALKTEEQLKEFANQKSNYVPVGKIIYEHDLKGCELPEGQTPMVVYLDYGQKGIAMKVGGM